MPIRTEIACSELEYLVMAMISRGITSGYAMRKQMDRMRGGRWSTESGSIYRALKRLEQSGLIKVNGRSGSPNRQRTEYELTPTGRSIHEEWLHSPVHPDELERLDDPVRARAYFLSLVAAGDREMVVKSWISGTRNLIESIKYDIERNQNADAIDQLALNGYLAVAEARLTWLRRLADSLASVS